MKSVVEMLNILHANYGSFIISQNITYLNANTNLFASIDMNKLVESVQGATPERLSDINTALLIMGKTYTYYFFLVHVDHTREYTFGIFAQAQKCFSSVSDAVGNLPAPVVTADLEYQRLEANYWGYQILFYRAEVSLHYVRHESMTPSAKIAELKQIIRASETFAEKLQKYYRNSDLQKKLGINRAVLKERMSFLEGEAGHFLAQLEHSEKPPRRARNMSQPMVDETHQLLAARETSAPSLAGLDNPTKSSPSKRKMPQPIVDEEFYQPTVVNVVKPEIPIDLQHKKTDPSIPIEITSDSASSRKKILLKLFFQEHPEQEASATTPSNVSISPK